MKLFVIYSALLFDLLKAQDPIELDINIRNEDPLENLDFDYSVEDLSKQKKDSLCEGKELLCAMASLMMGTESSKPVQEQTCTDG